MDRSSPGSAIAAAPPATRSPRIEVRVRVTELAHRRAKLARATRRWKEDRAAGASRRLINILAGSAEIAAAFAACADVLAKYADDLAENYSLGVHQGLPLGVSTRVCDFCFDDPPLIPGQIHAEPTPPPRAAPGRIDAWYQEAANAVRRLMRVLVANPGVVAALAQCERRFGDYFEVKVCRGVPRDAWCQSTRHHS